MKVAEEVQVTRLSHIYCQLLVNPGKLILVVTKRGFIILGVRSIEVIMSFKLPIFVTINVTNPYCIYHVFPCCKHNQFEFVNNSAI